MAVQYALTDSMKREYETKKNYVQKWEIGREKIVEKRLIVSMMRKVSAKPTQSHRIDIDIGPDAHIFKLFGNERENTEQPAITNV